MNHYILKTVRQTKKLVIAVIGFTLMGIGIVMIVLPGPAVIVLPVGLGVLATEFIWARKLLHRVKNSISNFNNKKPSNPLSCL